ncbi:MAG TPA: hypothetical protein PK175_09070 [Syntrophales bacterium]|nr:hypothetical protein [Syntrophales bacterium]HQG35009.1 hypothetical protein [Syntrophales bacterium]
MPYYLSLQYSAIQKTVLRHDRLWSIAGMSQGLARLNEVDLPDIVRKNNGEVLVAGGGKFTAKFVAEGEAGTAAQVTAEANAAQALREIRKAVATAFPMLEFQMSEVVAANDFADAKAGKRTERPDVAGIGPENNDADGGKNAKGILDFINEQKRTFRGFVTTYMPHLAICGECGEYPAESTFFYKSEGGRIYLCRICYEARNRAWTNLGKIAEGMTNEDTNGDYVMKERDVKSPRRVLTTLESIYHGYLTAVPSAKECELLLDFADMFPEPDDVDKAARRRMAVWFSDLNNMNQKVPIWLAQPEDKILHTFDQVKAVNIEVIVDALTKTFPNPKETVLPFRLVVAGGDDLCLVMPEEYILAFVQNLAAAVDEKVAELEKKGANPLSVKWLKEHADPNKDKEKDGIKPYSFGGAFVIASLHTPFKKIHALGEERLAESKKETDRWGNSVNWRIMAEENAVSEDLFKFERPLFVSKPEKTPAKMQDRLTFNDYIALCEKHADISSSHRFAVLARVQQFPEDQGGFAKALKMLDGATRSKSFSGLLDEEKLKHNGQPDPARFATLLELLTIKSQGGEP